MSPKERLDAAGANEKKEDLTLKDELRVFISELAGEHVDSAYYKTLVQEYIDAIQKDDLNGLDRLAKFMDNYLDYIRPKEREKWAIHNALRERLLIHIDRLLQ
jgi:hypothetical protein